MFLKRRWNKLWRRNNFSIDPEVISNLIYKNYNEPNRKYHNMNHIEQCLKMFDKISHYLSYPDDLEIAIWFHDIILNDENASADLCEIYMRAFDINRVRIERMKKLILATKDHQKVTVNDYMETKYMVDIDLSILGQPEKIYKKYAKSVREEFSHFSDEEFIKGRIAFLNKLLNKKIYISQYFSNKFEISAMSNILTELKTLKNGEIYGT